jgi:hypothetical protein
MSSEAFMVAFQEGYWRIGYQGRWYGTYKDKESAKGVAISIAMQMGELPTRVVIRERDGSEEDIWHPASKDLNKPTSQ